MCLLLLVVMAAVAAFVTDAHTLPDAHPIIARSDAATEFHKTLPSDEVWAEIGRHIDLPCNVTIPKADHINAIFWYYGINSVPLYSLDARDVDRSHAKHLVLGKVPGSLGILGKRVFVHGGSPPSSTLRVTNVTAADEGEFRCRIDFRDSPTANRRVLLRVVEQPDNPIILDSSGMEIMGSAGPFREGFELVLQCAVNGGRPRPEVEWWLNGDQLDTTVDDVNSTTSLNRLLLPSVPRDLWGALLECRTRSSIHAKSRTRRVQLDLSLKPLCARLHSPGGDMLSAGRSHRFLCDVWGSVPAARVSWLLDGEVQRGRDVSETHVANLTSSVLTLHLTREHDGSELTCRAENPDFIGLQKQDHRRIHVAFPPEVKVVLAEPFKVAKASNATGKEGGRNNGGLEEKTGEGVGTEVKTKDPVLREGESARLRCEVRAQPPPNHIVWFHKGAPLSFEDSGGSGGEGGRTWQALAAGRHELVLDRVRTEHAGEYECFARNREGEARSPPLRVRVNYSPRCTKGAAWRRVGVRPGRSVTVRCEVDASPSEVQFSWTEARGWRSVGSRSTGVSTDRIDASRITTRGTISEVRLDAPATGVESIELLCYAVNSVGRQEKPCVVFVVPASVPQPPVECSLANGTLGHLELVCRPGSDGDLPQYFELEVREQAVVAPRELPPLPSPATLSDQAQGATPTWEAESIGMGAAPAAEEAETGPPLHHFQGAEPRFELQLLQPGITYQLTVFAVNDIGRSDPPIVLTGVRMPDALSRHLPLERGKGTIEAPGSAKAAALQPTPIILAVVIAAAVLLLGGMVVTAALLACRPHQQPHSSLSTQSQLLPLSLVQLPHASAPAHTLAPAHASAPADAIAPAHAPAAVHVTNAAATAATSASSAIVVPRNSPKNHWKADIAS